MIKIACLSLNNTTIPNFSHETIMIEYYDDESLIEFAKYNFVIILNDQGNVNVLKHLKHIRTLFLKVIYVIDYRYNKNIVKDLFKYEVNDYLGYPLKNDYLIQKILSDNEFLRTNSLNYYKLNDLIIDFDIHCVFIDKKRISLTKLEFKLLRLLVTHSNRALPRQEILNEIWGFDGRDFRTLETHIKTLRRKLGKYKSNIVTVWSYGYLFIEITEEDKE